MKDVMEQIQFLLEKAKTSLSAAEVLLRSNHPDYCMSRAYYAMFYAAEAALLTKGLQFTKHSAVIAAFGKEFIKTGVFQREVSRQLRKAFNYRMEGDYGMVPVDADEAKVVLATASDFVETVWDYLKKEGFLP